MKHFLISVLEDDDTAVNINPGTTSHLMSYVDHAIVVRDEKGYVVKNRDGASGGIINPSKYVQEYIKKNTTNEPLENEGDIKDILEIF